MFATVDVCEGNINISFLIGLYFPPNWVLQVLLPLECLSSYGFPGYKVLLLNSLLCKATAWITDLSGQRVELTTCHVLTATNELFYYQKTSLSPVHCSVTMLVTSIAIVYTLLPMESTEYRVPQTLSSILAVFRMLQPRALSLLNPIHCSSVD